MQGVPLRLRLWKTAQMVSRFTPKHPQASADKYSEIADKLASKAQKITVKLPWEITSIYSEVLKQAGHQSDDEEDEDDIEAHEASIQRLKVRGCTTSSYYNPLFYILSPGG